MPTKTQTSIRTNEERMLLQILSFPFTALSQCLLPGALVLSLISEPITEPSVPVLEVVKVYGKLASRDCYGKLAPPGSSCQIKKDDLEGLFSFSDNKKSKADFATTVKALDFQWPLKPYGINPESLKKTAVMNKGAETRVFMGELERRKLYDPRNPTGPLPTSLRPILNRQIQSEGILDERAIDLAYEALLEWMGENDESPQQEFLDYYDFLKAIDPNLVIWPKE